MEDSDKEMESFLNYVYKDKDLNDYSKSLVDEVVSYVREADPNLSFDEKIIYALDKQNKRIEKEMEDDEEEIEIENIKFLHDKTLKSGVEFEFSWALNNIGRKPSEKSVVFRNNSGIEMFEFTCSKYDINDLVQLKILRKEKSIKRIKEQLQKCEDESCFPNIKELLKLLQNQQ